MPGQQQSGHRLLRPSGRAVRFLEGRAEVRRTHRGCAITTETSEPPAPSTPSLPRLARWVGRPLWCAWGVFVGWLFVYGMPLSGCAGVLGAWVARPGGTWRWRCARAVQTTSMRRSAYSRRRSWSRSRAGSDVGLRENLDEIHRLIYPAWSRVFRRQFGQGRYAARARVSGWARRSPNERLRFA